MEVVIELYIVLLFTYYCSINLHPLSFPIRTTVNLRWPTPVPSLIGHAATEHLLCVRRSARGCVQNGEQSADPVCALIGRPG